MLVTIGLCFALWLVARVATALLISVGPFLLIAAIFDTTRGWVMSWIGKLVSLAVWSLCSTALAEMMLSGTLVWVRRTAANAAGLSERVDGLWKLCVWILIDFAVMLALPYFASVGSGAAAGVHDGRCGERGFQRHFKLEKQHARLLQRGASLLDISQIHTEIAAGDDRDVILPALAHVDDGDAGGAVMVLADQREIEAIGGERALRTLAEVIRPDAPDEGHIAAELARGNGLVGALAAQAHDVFLAVQGLARLRQAIHVGRHVHVDAADDGDGHDGLLSYVLRLRAASVRSRSALRRMKPAASFWS